MLYSLLAWSPMLLLLEGETNAWDAIVTAITGSVSVSTISTVLVSGIGAAIALVFFWFAARKVTRMIMGAFKGGHLGV